MMHSNSASHLCCKLYSVKNSSTDLLSISSDHIRENQQHSLTEPLHQIMIHSHSASDLCCKAQHTAAALHVREPSRGLYVVHIAPLVSPRWTNWTAGCQRKAVHLQCALHIAHKHSTRVSLKWGVEYELSPILGPVQNQILHSRGSSCVGTLRNSVSLSQAYQENPLDIGLDTLPVFVFDSP